MASTSTAPARQYDWTGRHLAALLGANMALALGPWFVRLADSGPVSAGFWRLFLPLPVLFLLARREGPLLAGVSRRQGLAIALAGVVFSLDLASWHVGIGMTRLGNATLFGNAGSLIVMAWGVVAMRRRPDRFESGAMLLALAGSAILLGRSLEIGRATLIGDLFCLLAGTLYAGYIIILQDARARMGNWSLLACASLAGAPVLLGIALALGEPVIPTDWRPLLGLALCSQLIGQGLLVYSMRHVPPLLLGLALMTQPAIAAAVGWLVFGETLSMLDVAGMSLIGMAMLLVGQRRARG